MTYDLLNNLSKLALNYDILLDWGLSSLALRLILSPNKNLDWSNDLIGNPDKDVVWSTDLWLMNCDSWIVTHDLWKNLSQLMTYGLIGASYYDLVWLYGLVWAPELLSISLTLIFMALLMSTTLTSLATVTLTLTISSLFTTWDMEKSCTGCMGCSSGSWGSSTTGTWVPRGAGTCNKIS